MLASVSILVELSLGNVLYPKLAYAQSFTEKVCSFKQILFKM